MKKELMLIIFTIIASAFSSAETIQANQYAIWGIGHDEITIPDGSLITEAVLTITDVTPGDKQYYVHLLDNTNPGFQRTTTTDQGNDFEGYGVPLAGAFENGNLVFRFSQNNDVQSRMWTVYANPCTLRLADTSTVQLSSSILELMEYAGNGKGFGIGLDKEYDGQSFAFQNIYLSLTLQSYTTVSASQTLTFSYKTGIDFAQVPGLAGYWKLDENWGSNAVEDFGTNGASGAATVATSSLHTEGCIDGGFQFSGTQSVTIADHDGLDMGTGDFSISFAFKLDQFNDASFWNAVLSKGLMVANGAFYGIYVASNNKLYFMAGGAANFACSNYALNDSQFHHITAVRSAGQLVLYVDGIAQYKTGVFAGDVSNTSALMFGTDSSPLRYFCGVLDDVRLHNYALQTSQITELAKQVSGSSAGLVNYWKLDDNNDSTTVLNEINSVAQGTASVETASLFSDGGFTFTGAQSVSVADSASLNMGTGDFSVSFAFKLNQFNDASFWNAVLSKGLMSANGAFYGIYVASNNKLYFMAGSAGNFACSNSALNDGQFHHITAVRSSGQLILYVDGAAQYKTGTFTGDVSNTSAMMFGTDASPIRFFSGSLDEIRMYNYALTTAEIDELKQVIN
ncbi:MAG: LamG domain-containing protein [Sedimentisphaerales bacterium]|nr:LamG domain-containing protein [Sedimentisphaerales bacterium]